MARPLIQQIAAQVKRLQKDIRFNVEVDLAESARQAEALERGSLFFYKTREVKIGLEAIDWSGAHIDHQEWPSELNRFFVLLHLATMYGKNRDEKYPRMARRIIADWITSHDYGQDKPLACGDNTLNLSIRLGQSTGWGWWPAVAAFAPSKAFDAAFVSTMIESSAGQLDALRQKISTVGNWRISQLDTLLFCGLTVPGLDRHLDFAVRSINEAFHRQIHPDGSHEEHNPSYHNWMCEVFTAFWRLSRARPRLGLKLDTEKACRMWNYAVCSAAPDGGSAGIHDSEGWSPGKGDETLLKKRAQLLKEAKVTGPEWDLKANPSRYFADAGQIFLRSGFQPSDTLLFFDASRWGGAHCHLSRNAISLYHGGRMLLCDPGIFSYEMSDPFAPYGKSTPAHNTVNLSGMNQCEANPDTTLVEFFEDAAVIHSRYTAGYYPGAYHWDWYEGHRAGTFGIHGRTLLWLSGRCALVVDDLTVDRAGQPYALHWQLPAGKSTCDSKNLRAWTLSEESNILVQVLSASDDVKALIIEGQNVVIRGWLPTDLMGGRAPAPQLIFEANARSPRSVLTTLLLPFAGAEVPEIESHRFTCAPDSTQGYTLAWEDGNTDVIAVSPGLNRQIGMAGELETDASLAVVSLRNGSPWRVILIGGLYLMYKGKTLVDQPKAGNYRMMP